MRTFFAFFFALFTALLWPSQAEGSAGLTSADEVREATYDNLPARRPFKFTATVAMPPIGPSLPVLDNSGSVCVYLGAATIEKAHELRAGDKIQLFGDVCHSTKNGYNYATVQSFTILGRGEKPKPSSVTTSEIESPDFRMRFVSLKGFIADVFRDEIDPRFIFFVLSDGTYCAYLALLCDPADRLPSHLIGADVEVEGIVKAPRSNTLNRKIQNVIVAISAIDDIKIIKDAPKDPFSVPALYEDGLTMLGHLKSGLKRRRVAGRILAQWSDSALVRTADGLLSRVQFAEEPYPRCGTYIEAAGIPDTDFFRLNLSRAIWRETERRENDLEPAATPLTIEALLRDKRGNTRISATHYGQPVTISGILTAKPTASLKDMRAEIACDDLRLAIDITSAPHALDDIEPYSEINVTGIYIIEAEAWRAQTPYPHIRDIFICIRSADDIRVLSHPPWWTAERLITVIGVLLVALVAVTVWNRTLNRLSRQRGCQLANEQIAREKATLKAAERTRLAVEIHDTLAQNLTGVAMEIETANKLREGASPEMLTHIDIASRALKSCRDEIRNCIWDLRSRALEEPDMAKAVAKTLQPYTKTSKIDIFFDVPMSTLCDNTAHTILRIVRELVINATRHARATYIKIQGELSGAEMTISVEDNGIGFDTKSAPGVPQGHFGLQGIRERLNEIQGNLTIKSVPGDGTIATVTLRLTPESHIL